MRSARMTILDFWAAILFAAMKKVLKVIEVPRVETEHQNLIKSLMTRKEVTQQERATFKS